jgi:glycosyltransferase involved in cell wall biosynthesis
MITGTFATPSGQPWLMDDLAHAMADEGATVDVLVFESRTPRPRTGWVQLTPAIRYMSLGLEQPRRPGRLGAATTHTSNMATMHRAAWRAVKDERYDLGLYTSIGTLAGGFPGRLRKHGVVRHLGYILWDFFPRHHREIGSLSGPVTRLEPVLKRVERASFARADSIVLMSTANESFLRAYHPGVDATIVISPPWAREDEGPLDDSARVAAPFTVVCGGQLTHGRGIETLMDASELLIASGDDVEIEVYGWGPDSERLKAEAAQRRLAKVHIRDGLPRSDYRRVLMRSHAGVTVNVPGVSIPTFPTKISDYCLAALPVIACLEESTDAGTVLEEAGAGLSVQVGDAEALADAIRTVRREWESGAWAERSRASRHLYDVHLSAAVAARRMLAAAMDDPGERHHG